MEFFSLPFWQGFVGNIFATIIGVALGIPIAFWINRRVESFTERERKAKILEMLSFELGYNKAILGSWLETKDPEVWMSLMYGTMLKDESWNAFSLGGELQWIKDPVLLTYIADVYGDVREIRNSYELLIKHRREDTTLRDVLLRLVARTTKKTKLVLDLIEKSTLGATIKYDDASELQT